MAYETNEVTPCKDASVRNDEFNDASDSNQEPTSRATLPDATKVTAEDIHKARNLFKKNMIRK